MNQAHVQCGFPSVRGDRKHVVGVRINTAAANGLGSLAQLVNEGFQGLCGRDDHNFRLAAVDGGSVQVQCLVGFDVCKSGGQTHHFGNIGKPCETSFHPVTLALGGQFQTCDRFAERGCPIIENRQTMLIANRGQLLVESVFNQFHRAAAMGAKDLGIVGIVQ